MARRVAAVFWCEVGVQPWVSGDLDHRGSVIHGTVRGLRPRALGEGTLLVRNSALGNRGARRRSPVESELGGIGTPRAPGRDILSHADNRGPRPMFTCSPIASPAVDVLRSAPRHGTGVDRFPTPSTVAAPRGGSKQRAGPPWPTSKTIR